MNKLLTYIFLAYLFSSCQEPLSKANSEGEHTYLHIAHTRTDINPTIDSIVEKVNFDKYNMLWLGGDLSKSSSIDDMSMAYIDSIFNVKNETTLWALGNHDYSSLNRIEAYTNRPPYYSYHKNGLTIVVIDTQDSLSNIIGEQERLVKTVLDTLEKSSHLILLHHKLIWMYGNEKLEPKANSISNGGLGSCFHCINPNNFYSDIYPTLVKVREKGIGVICVAGDIVFKSNKFEYETPEGIHFLASGIDSKKKNNQALIFHHDLSTGNLNWSFESIESL